MGDKQSHEATHQIACQSNSDRFRVPGLDQHAIDYNRYHGVILHIREYLSMLMRTLILVTAHLYIILAQ